MRIACPSCASEYEVPASRLTPRKMVRCASCGGEWIPVHTTDDTVPPLEPAEDRPSSPLVPEAAPAVTAMDRLAAAKPPRRSSAGLVGAWALTFVVLAGVIAATVIWREAVVRAWPQSALVLAPFDRAVPQPAKTEGKKADW